MSQWRYQPRILVPILAPILAPMLAIAMVAVVWAQSRVALAESTLDFTGHFMQGGLVIGQTLPGSEVRHGDRQVRVSDTGVFVLGFDRDAPATGSLSVVLPGGRTTHHPITVAPQTYRTTRIDGLAKRHVTPQEEDLKRIRSDNKKISAVRRLNSEHTDFLSGFVWPVKGRISGVFGSQRILNGQPRRPHNGVDIAAPKGTPVRATADGIIRLIDNDMFFSGKTVMIDHGHGLTSVYVHMNDITIKQGSTVRQGQQIGTVGMTGRATGPHLHWGISLFGTPLDPKLIVVGQRNLTHTD